MRDEVAAEAAEDREAAGLRGDREAQSVAAALDRDPATLNSYTESIRVGESHPLLPVRASGRCSRSGPPIVAFSPQIQMALEGEATTTLTQGA